MGSLIFHMMHKLFVQYVSSKSNCFMHSGLCNNLIVFKSGVIIHEELVLFVLFCKMKTIFIGPPAHQGLAFSSGSSGQSLCLPASLFVCVVVCPPDYNVNIRTFVPVTHTEQDWSPAAALVRRRSGQLWAADGVHFQRDNMSGRKLQKTATRWKDELSSYVAQKDRIQ